MPKSYCLFLRDVSLCLFSYAMIGSPKVKYQDWKKKSIDFYFEVKDRIGLNLVQHNLD